MRAAPALAVALALLAASPAWAALGPGTGPAPALGSGLGSAPGPDGLAPSAAPRIPHGPILIVGDEGFLALVANGILLGSGSPEDPYLLQGWDIATLGLADGIRVQGTTKHLVIRGNAVHDGDPGFPATACYRTISIRCEPAGFPPPTDGIVLVDAANVVVEHNVLERNGAAIRLERSQAVLRHNHVVGKGTASPEACGDVPQGLWDAATGLPWPRLVQQLGLVPWRYHTAPAAGILALDSAVRVEGGRAACATVGLAALRGSLDAEGFEAAHVFEGIAARGAQVRIAGARVHNATHAGFALGDGTQGTLQGSSTTLAGRGLYACGQGTSLRVEGNAFRQGLQGYTDGAGVFADSTFGCPGNPHVDIVGNTIEDVNAGIQWIMATGSIVDNEVRRAAWYGIYTQFTSPDVRSNTVEDSDLGVLLRWHRGTVEGNVVRDNRVGVAVFGDPSLVPGPKPVLRNNSLHGNAQWDLANSEAAHWSASLPPGLVALDAAHTWWGSAQGPAQGKVHGAAQVEPWLLAAP